MRDIVVEMGEVLFRPNSSPNAKMFAIMSLAHEPSKQAIRMKNVNGGMRNEIDRIAPISFCRINAYGGS